MFTVAVDGLSTEKLHEAAPFESLVVAPSTVAVEPRKLIALAAWLAFCKFTSEVSCWFMLICCSTPANDTNCWVNWLVSSGSSGFWFFSWVVSNVRNVSKFCASVALLVTLDVGTPEAAFGAVPVCDVTAAASRAIVSAMVRPHTLMSTPPPRPIIRP